MRSHSPTKNFPFGAEPEVPVKTFLNLILHFDGSITVNPGGIVKIGWHLDTLEGERVAEGNGPIFGYPTNERTNNTAELEAMLAGLKWVGCFRLASIDTLTVIGDSQFAIDLVTGKWKAKKPHLKKLRDRCQAAVEKIESGHLEFKWVPRRENSVADALAK